MAQVMDIGVDLGTASVVIYGKNKGIVLDEPAVIAFDRESRAVLAVGHDAYRMLGRTPSNVVALRPLRNGTIEDFSMATAMLNYFVQQVVGKRLFLGGPRVVLSLPAGVNEVERQSITASLFSAGARRTHLMERPVAAAIGAGLQVGETYGSMIVDIGGGMTEIAVISKGRCVLRDSVKMGGDRLDDAIIKYIRLKHNMLIGEMTAEDLKVNIGSALQLPEQLYMEVTGRNLISGLPKILRVTSDEVTEAIEGPLEELMEAIHAVLEQTPAELAADIFDNGIVLTGGGAHLSMLSQAVSKTLKIDCRVADNAHECVARGCGLTLENWSEYGRFIGKRGQSRK